MSSPLLRLSDLGFEEIPEDWNEEQLLSMYFPLFRLPDVPLKEVLRNLSLIEILYLVQTSRRSKRRIWHQRTPTKILVVDGDYDFYVQFSYGNKETFKIEMETRGDYFNSYWMFQYFVPVRLDGNILVSRWKTAIDAFQQVLEFLDAVFRIKEISFEIKPYWSGRAVPIMEHVASRNMKIGSVDWSKFCGSDEMAGSWMTVENLVALRNCKRINLENVRLNAVNMNKILREYMRNPGNLQEIRIRYYGSMKLEKIVKDLNIVGFEEGNKETEPKYWLTTDNGIRFTVTKEFYGAVVITRDA
uniref:F-box domain-containing protein n=1 Tax=Caenorhabditis tropicalis TaxID=1561998 RepID=A0A1I7UT81_9PELO